MFRCMLLRGDIVNASGGGDGAGLALLENSGVVLRELGRVTRWTCGIIRDIVDANSKCEQKCLPTSEFYVFGYFFKVTSFL